MSDYAFKNLYGVLAVLDRATIDKPKAIRFIYPDYQEKFCVPDGEQVIVIYPSGEKKAFVCKYLDETHALIGRRAYHICEYAERIEKLGARVYPFPEKRIIWQDIDLDLNDWECLREEYPDYSEQQLTEIMYEINSEYLDDERCNLNIQSKTTNPKSNKERK